MLQIYLTTSGNWITSYKEEINKNKILENGNIIIKYQNNAIQNIYKNDGSSDNINWNQFYQNNLNTQDFINLGEIKPIFLFFEYLMNFEEDFDYRTYFSVRPGSITGNKQIFGILDYKGDDEVNKNIFHKHPVYFTLFGKPDNNPNKKGPIYLLNDFNIEYELSKYKI